MQKNAKRDNFRIRAMRRKAGPKKIRAVFVRSMRGTELERVAGRYTSSLRRCGK